MGQIPLRELLRNTIKIARISSGTEVKYAVGTARKQLSIADPRPEGWSSICV